MIKHMLGAVVAGAVVLTALPSAADATLARRTVSGNFIHNGNAELATGSTDGSTVPVPQWTMGTGTTTFTAVQYGASGGFPTVTDPGPPSRGANFLAGGPGDAVAVATQLRTIPVALRSAIDAGTATFALQGFLGGFSSQDDNAVLSIEWRTGTNAALGTAAIGPVTAANRNSLTGLKSRKTTGTVPAGARKVFIQLTMTRDSGAYNDGYADNLSLKITTP
jgi:hypothetical protein